MAWCLCMGIHEHSFRVMDDVHSLSVQRRYYEKEKAIWQSTQLC